MRDGDREPVGVGDDAGDVLRAAGPEVVEADDVAEQVSPALLAQRRGERALELARKVSAVIGAPDGGEKRRPGRIWNV